MARIYLDYASLTPIDPRVLLEMKAYRGTEYANPSSIYKEGVAAKKAVAGARERIADFIHAHADEIVFTSGGTEANGLALEGAGRAARMSGTEKLHIVTTNIEHSSVLEVVNMMEKHGMEVTRLSVGQNGVVSADGVRKAIKPNTFMVSVMTVNNEIGSVQPIREIAKAVRWAREHVTKTRYPLLHTDAAQAALFTDLNVEKLGVDLMTLDSGKVYGPRSMGALFVRRGVPIEPIIYGGGQERGLRSGTENVPAIMGFAKALDIAAKEREVETNRIAELRNYFADGLKKVVPGLVVNTTVSSDASPHILNVSIPGIDNEFFVLQLDVAGACVSTKSSCLQDEDESYVLKAIGADSKTSVRFSFGRWTKKRDLAKTLKIVAKILSK